MHKNAIKIVWGGLGSHKLCAFYHKCGAFLVGKNCAPFCALFGQKMCAFEFKIIKNSAFTKFYKKYSPTFYDKVSRIGNEWQLDIEINEI